MIDVSEVLDLPEFRQSQPITVTRSSGSFALGGWQNSSTTILISAVVTVANEEDLQQVPEGDRVLGAMTFHSKSQLYRTHNDQSAGLSDILTWRNQQYRIAAVAPYADYGYWKAIGLRISGE